MKIIKESIKSISEKNSILYKLSGDMAVASVVNIISKRFSFELINKNEPNFTMKNMHEVFYDWELSDICSKQKISGSIEKSNYVESQKQVALNFSNSNSQLLLDEIRMATTIFWQEISANFTLPPTHVYIHEPDTDSLFDFGIYWKFCYIYLNNNTKEGIVFAADASD